MPAMRRLRAWDRIRHSPTPARWLVLHGAAVRKASSPRHLRQVRHGQIDTRGRALPRGLRVRRRRHLRRRPRRGNRPVVLPDGRQLKLWRESIEQLDLASAPGRSGARKFRKILHRSPGQRRCGSLLCAIYVLRKLRPPLNAGIEPLALPDAMRALDYQAYRPGCGLGSDRSRR